MTIASITGVGMTPFGVHNEPLEEMFADAALAAIDDAGVDHDEIDSLYIGNALGGAIENETHLGPKFVSYLGLSNECPAQRYEDACSSSAIALKEAVRAVQSGCHETVLVSGVERCTPKGTDVDTEHLTKLFASGSHKQYEQPLGMTSASVFALLTKRHMYEHGTNERQLAEVAVKNHANGAKNPRAQFAGEKTVEDVLDSPMISDPFRLLDCCPFSDGAAAAVITNAESAETHTGSSVNIVGLNHMTSTLPLADQETAFSTPVARRAANRAYREASVSPSSVDVAEVHDCFTGAEIMAIEALDFVEEGHGGVATAEGQTQLDGEIPVNPSGGLKAKGHPVGATGIAQIVELTDQLRGNAKNRQVENARTALAHNVGGSAASAVVTIMEAPT